MLKKLLRKILKPILTNTGPQLYLKKKNNEKKLFFNNIALKSFGNKNKEKIFYIIRRSPGAGLFSNFIYVVNHLLIADKHNFIPVIDMENYPTIYNEKNSIHGTKNAWLYYFEPVSKYSLNDVYKSRNVIISTNIFYKTFVHRIFANKNLLKFSKKIIIKKYIKQKVHKFLTKNLFNKNKTLGIHYRGTSYKDSANHPFPPTYSQLVKKIDNLLRIKKFDKIFFASEDKAMFDLILKRYKDKIVYYNSFRSIKDDAFKRYDRSNHRFKLGEEILIEGLILSKCHTFLFVETNVSTFVRLLKNKNQTLIPFKNGFNSSNEYIAKWLWYVKKILPDALGGFKI